LATRLAVLITYFNEGGLLRQCLDSLLLQRDAPDEVIVYDDASSVLPDSHVPAGSCVRVVRASRNQGPGHGRNALLRETDCEYVHFHDADDLFAPDWSQEVRAAIARTQPDIVLTEIRSIRNGVPVSDRVLGVDELQGGGDLIRFGLQGSLLVPSTTFRRALALEIGGFRPREILAQSEDFDFHIRLAAAARSYTVVSRPLIIQRLRSGSHSADLESCWTSALRSVELLADTLPPQYRVDAADAAARIGSELYAINSRSQARAAFRLADSLGPARFLHRPRGYRMVARLLGPGAAEWVAAAYRRIIPKGVRASLPRLTM
jgi:glycosyltransferase involved in cell wall biosynthesis